MAIAVNAVIFEPQVRRRDPGLHQVLFEEAPRPPELLAELHELEEQAVAVVAALLRADPAVDVADPDMAARLAVNTVESLVHRSDKSMYNVKPGWVPTDLSDL